MTSKFYKYYYWNLKEFLMMAQKSVYMEYVVSLSALLFFGDLNGIPKIELNGRDIVSEVNDSKTLFIW